MTFRITTALAALAVATPALAEVNIYSQRQPELIAPLTDAFTEATGIETNTVYIDQGLTERLSAEGSRSPADIIMTVDISRLSQAVDAGVTQAVESETLSDNIPAEFRDPGNQWFGVTTRARIVYASKDRVAEGEVTTYEDLADPKWQGRICTRSGTHPYNLALTSAMIHHHGYEAAKAWAEGVKANLARKPQGNDRAQVKAIWAGECDISLGNTYYMGKMLEDPEQTEWANSVRIVFPTFEDSGSHMNVSGVAMTAAAPHREDALKFMEFLASPEAQQIYAEVNYEFPVKPGVERSELVQSWGNFTPDTVNLMDLSALRADALRLMEEVNFDG
ncbi:Fe(3+) ABC transporter substrate-binding protein [Thalassococcus sp. BH17M4-6]|uniref:Fe(3+) ABC transporter substrate-binding protein n=1 Tax=Thalassococcus sp. BH17M4-6 TaxID=3413148 RepID=UPI003BBDEEFC